MDGLIVRKMEKNDLQAVHAIEQASFITPWSFQSLKGELKNKLAYYCVAETDSRIVGYAGMWSIFDESHITNVAVDSEYRRQGIGKAIMEHMVEAAKSRGATSMTLEVRANNTAAQTLYFNMGFVRGGLRRGYYTDTNEDALILWKQLTQ